MLRRVVLHSACEQPCGHDQRRRVVGCRLGILLQHRERTATAQLNAATIVSNPQPGDLVFTVSGGIATHVGIYTGPGMMIDSPRTGKATSERAIFSGNVYGRF